MTIQCDFFARFPELNNDAASFALDTLVDVWPSYYGRPYNSSTKETILNLLAHLVTVNTTAGSGAKNALASKSVGSVSLSYAMPPVSSQRQSFYGSTKYGQMFLILTAKYGGVAFV
jgi:hypothetical protein